MWIADLSFPREVVTEGAWKWKKFGRVWWGEDRHYAKVAIRSYRQGVFAGAVYAGVKTPEVFIEGDLLLPAGTYEFEGRKRRRFEWCGFITSRENKAGLLVFEGAIECLPFWAFNNFRPESGGYIFLRVALPGDNLEISYGNPANGGEAVISQRTDSKPTGRKEGAVCGVRPEGDHGDSDVRRGAAHPNDGGAIPQA